MPSRYIKIGKRILIIHAFPDSICVQQVYPALGPEFCYPFEEWMVKLTRPSLFPFSE